MDHGAEHRVECSVVVIAGAEARNIAGCLASVAWAAERIVVCSSDDGTMEIARAAGATVFFRAFDGYAAQKQFALDQATQDWVLSLDADERATPELQAAIERTMRDATARDGYRIPRRNYFGTKWLRHGGWYPDLQLRFFRRTRTRLSHRLVHEKFEVEGTIGTLDAPIDHHTLPRVAHLLEKNVQYALFEAREKYGRRRITMLDFLLRPPFEFTKKYVVQGGFLDGWEGFIVAAIHASNKLNVLIHMWEMQYRPDNTRAHGADD